MLHKWNHSVECLGVWAGFLPPPWLGFWDSFVCSHGLRFIHCQGYIVQDSSVCTCHNFFPRFRARGRWTVSSVKLLRPSAAVRCSPVGGCRRTWLPWVGPWDQKARSQFWDPQRSWESIFQNSISVHGQRAIAGMWTGQSFLLADLPEDTGGFTLRS